MLRAAGSAYLRPCGARHGEPPRWKGVGGGLLPSPMKTQVWGSSPRAPMAAAMPCKSAEWLQEELESGGGRSLLLLDCRSHELFESSHIETAINLAIPGLMLRRLKKGNLPIRSIIPNHEDKERFVKRCKADTVLLYDEATADWQDAGAAGSVLGLLLQKLRDDGCKAYYLKGELPASGSCPFSPPRFHPPHKMVGVGIAPLPSAPLYPPAAAAASVPARRAVLGRPRLCHRSPLLPRNGLPAPSSPKKAFLPPPPSETAHWLGGGLPAPGRALEERGVSEYCPRALRGGCGGGAVS